MNIDVRAMFPLPWRFDPSTGAVYAANGDELFHSEWIDADDMRQQTALYEFIVACVNKEQAK